MANLNKVMLIGRLTRDPELRHIPSGSAVCELGLATSRSFKGRDGEQREDTLFVDIVTWNRQAEICHQYLAKGREVFVEGRLEMDQWEDKETGQRRTKYRVVADRVQFLGGRQDGEGGGGGGGAQRGGRSEDRGYGRSYHQDSSRDGYEKSQGKQPAVESTSFAEDDVPF